MNFPAAALEAFQILRSYNYQVILYDEEGNQVYEPEDARRFFVKPDNLLVSIIDDGEDSSVRVYLSKNTNISSVQGLCDTLRSMSSKYKMIFHLKKRNRVLAPKDFSTGAAVAESILYGTSKKSYLTIGECQIVIKHTKSLTENSQEARKSNIDSLSISHLGKTTAFPGTNLLPAQAMVTHVSRGGSWADEVGQYIVQAANEISLFNAPTRRKGIIGGKISESLEALRDHYDTSKMITVDEKKDRLCPLFSTFNEWVNNFGTDDSELSMADVILPTNQGNDLENEITPATTADPSSHQEVEPDTSYINRLSSIAGFR